MTELGAGANPLLSSAPRIVAGDLQYLRVDISEQELEKSSGPGEAVVADVSVPGLRLPASDLIISKNLAEHVRDGETFLSNVCRSLAPGGSYLQLSPVLFALPFVVNHLIPESLGHRVLQRLQPRDPRMLGKFPAHYSWCRAPTPRFLRRVERLGFSVRAARGYFGHNYYARVKPLHALERTKSAWLAEHPVPLDCAFSLLVLGRDE